MDFDGLDDDYVPKGISPEEMKETCDYLGNLPLFRRRPSGLHRGGHFAFPPVTSSPTFLSPISSFPAPPPQQ